MGEKPNPLRIYIPQGTVPVQCLVSALDGVQVAGAGAFVEEDTETVPRTDEGPVVQIDDEPVDDAISYVEPLSAVVTTAVEPITIEVPGTAMFDDDEETISDGRACTGADQVTYEEQPTEKFEPVSPGNIADDAEASAVS